MRDMSDTELGKRKEKRNSLLSLFTSLYRLLQTANVVSTESILIPKCPTVIPIISLIILEPNSVIADLAPKYSPPNVQTLSESTR